MRLTIPEDLIGLVSVEVAEALLDVKDSAIRFPNDILVAHI